MAGEADFRRIAMGLAGTTWAPHVDRTAFKVARIYATLASDGLSANLSFAPEEQALKCLVAGDAFTPVRGVMGAYGLDHRHVRFCQ